MADPQIKSSMDNLDYLTVILYRLGYVLATIMLPLLVFKGFSFDSSAYFGVLIAATMLASSVHLYLKNYRVIFQYAMWIGLLLAIVGQSWLALGAAFLVIGGLCFKEFFCFRIFALNYQPFFMAGLWFSLVCNWTVTSYFLTAIATLLLLILSIQKRRMPIHFDIGDKTKYQV